MIRPAENIGYIQRCAFDLNKDPSHDALKSLTQNEPKRQHEITPITSWPRRKPAEQMGSLRPAPANTGLNVQPDGLPLEQASQTTGNMITLIVTRAVFTRSHCLGGRLRIPLAAVKLQKNRCLHVSPAPAFRDHDQADRPPLQH